MVDRGVIDRGVVVRLAVLAVVSLVGVGACASVPQQGGAGLAGSTADGSAGRETGAGAAPTPTRPQADRSTPTGTPAPRPTTVEPPASTRPSPTRSSARPTPSRSSATGDTGGCPQGERQREVETYLARLGGFGKVTVDGRQSAADCEAIKKFQRRYDIRPAHGRAGPLTYDVARRLATTDVSRCRTGSGTTFCIDLTRQTTWAMRDGRVVWGPTVTRTGMAGYATPTGTYKINFRNVKEWSDPYEVWLPYWQRFVGGIGYHETTTYLHNMPIGSHGCINLLPVDARRAWELGRVGSRVHVFGHRPGT